MSLKSRQSLASWEHSCQTHRRLHRSWSSQNPLDSTVGLESSLCKWVLASAPFLCKFSHRPGATQYTTVLGQGCPQLSHTWQGTGVLEDTEGPVPPAASTKHTNCWGSLELVLS